MAEKLKERFTISVNDELTGLHVYAAQKKWPEYREKFEIFFNEDLDEEFRLSFEISKQLGQTLMNFDSDEFKSGRLMLSEKLIRRLQDSDIPCGGELFHNLAYVYVEAQRWEDVARLLRQQTEAGTCKPAYKTVSYLKANTVYCFQNAVRMNLQGAIDSFERAYFKHKPRQQISTRSSPSRNMDTIESEDLAEMRQMDKKIMRREARRAAEATTETAEGEADAEGAEAL